MESLLSFLTETFSVKGILNRFKFTAACLFFALACNVVHLDKTCLFLGQQVRVFRERHVYCITLYHSTSKARAKCNKKCTKFGTLSAERGLPHLARYRRSESASVAAFVGAFVPGLFLSDQ